MWSKVRTRLTYSNVVATLALFLVLAGGGAWAAKKFKLKPNSVHSIQIAPDAASGEDVNEATLGKVPSAANADRASSADNASSAGNASTLNGLASTAFISGTGSVLHASLSVTSGSEQDIISVPGLGVIEVDTCIPSATPASRSAIPTFRNPVGGPSLVDVWHDGGFNQPGGRDNGTVAPGSGNVNTFDLGSFTAGNPQANELIDVYLRDSATGRSATVTVAEKTGSTDCRFNALAVVSG